MSLGAAALAAAAALGLAALAGGLLAAAVHNRLSGLRNAVRRAFAQVDVQLRRRHDLVPPLVEATRAALAHERAVVEAVVAARARAVAAEEEATREPGAGAAMAALGAAEGALVAAIGGLRAVVEGLPDLRANEAVARLFEELLTAENRVAFARQAYNDAVLAYETSRGSFPAALLAGPLGFGPAHYFRVDDAAERAAPRLAAEVP